MSDNERDFRKLVAGLRTHDEPDSAHRERLRRQMLATYERAGGRRVPVEAGAKLVRAIRLRFARPAIAAAILIAATAGMWMWFGSAGGRLTFERVRLATQDVPWLLAVATKYSNGDVRTERHWYNFAAKEVYTLAEENEAVTALEYGAESIKLAYNPRIRTLTISDLPRAGLFGAESAYNVIDAFAVFATRDDVVESTVEYEGRAVRAYSLETAARSTARLKMTLIADPGTRRIVAASVEHRDRTGNTAVREDWVMSYPPSGPASVYDLNVPRTARVIDERPSHTGTPSDGPMPVPTPVRTSGFRLEPLKIELPKAKFIGTPTDARMPNVEKPRGAPRPTFLAPAGTINVARGKPVASSDPEPLAGGLDLITDGDKEATDDGLVELGPRPQHVTIDLQERCEIYAVVLWHQHRWPRVYRDVVVQIADDPAFKARVRTIFNNDEDNSLGLGVGRDLAYTETYEGKLIDAKSIQGRYVRCYSNGNTHDELNHYLEVEVYGRSAKSIQNN